MRAVAVFPADRAIRLVEHPEPKIDSARGCMVRILDVGVCGTDREIARFDYGTAPPGSPYLVLGHESFGEVIETGPAVSRLRVGDLVVTTVRRPCPHPDCRACASGRQDFCFTGDFTERGIKGRHGYMTERIVDDERYMHVVPAALRDVGVLIEPLTIAEKALIQVWDVQERLPWTAPGSATGDGVGDGDGNGTRPRALVLGAGPVGLLGAMALVVRGFETWVYSREPVDSDKARWVEAIGCRYLSSTTTPVPGLPAAMGNIDLMYEATGASSLAFQLLEVLGVNGVFVFTGVPGRKAPINVDTDLLMRNLVLKNQLVFGTVNAGADAFEAAAVDLTRFEARWPVQLRALITGRHPPEAFEELLLKPGVGIKQLISFAGR